MGITDDWAFAAATVLVALQRYRIAHDYDLIIYHHNLRPRNQRLLNEIHPCSFRDYDITLLNPERFSRLSRLTFSRYECFALLQTYSKVLWLDSDILIKSDISNLFSIDQSGIAMYKHERIPIIVSFSSSVSGFDMTKDCYNSGLLLVTDKLENPQELKDWCYRKTNEWATSIMSDQAIINLMLQEFDLTVSHLDITFNCHPDKESCHTVILHPWGNRKFWDGRIHPLWDYYYLQWTALGGDGPIIRWDPLRRLIIFRMLYRELTLRCKCYQKLANINAHFRTLLSRLITPK